MNQQIVTTARGWIGTRFHHQGRLKKTENNCGGVDCLGLLIGVARELNLPFSQYDERDYAHYPDTDKLRAKLTLALNDIPCSSIAPGDILLFNIDGNPQHMAIVGEIDSKATIIHAYAPARAVVEHYLDSWWQEKIVSAYSVSK